jgi:hypothetical protein
MNFVDYEFCVGITFLYATIFLVHNFTSHWIITKYILYNIKLIYLLKLDTTIKIEYHKKRIS